MAASEVPPEIVTFLEDLRPETRAWLAELRPEEVGMLRDGTRWVSAISTVSRFVRWTIILIAGVIVGMSALGEAILKMWHWAVPPLGPKP
ncbi:hypothetical protein ACRC7T_13800 [Segnochrobactraceae bacterium EtOH-i3]